MKKHKFVLTKYIKQNSNYYYTCTVLLESVRKPKNIFELLKYAFRNGVKYMDAYYIHETGSAYKFQDYPYEERADALLAIDRYIEQEELKYGEKIASTETEIIYK